MQQFEGQVAEKVQQPSSDPDPAPEELPVPAATGRGRGAAIARTVGPPLALLVVLAAAWEYLPGAFGIKEFVLPPLSDVLAQFESSNVREQLWTNGIVTLHAALVGLAIGASTGILCGLVLGESALARATLYPFMVALQSLPKVAIAPLFVIWFGFGATPKVLVAATLTFFPLLVNTMSGVMSVDRDQAQLFRSLSASRRQTWTKLLLPSALPSILAGFELATVLALLGSILGDFVSSQDGLGVLLIQQQTNYDTAGVFATLMVLAVIGVVLNQVVVQLRKRLVSW